MEAANPPPVLPGGAHAVAWLAVSMSVRDRILLWGHSGNRCAFPDCRRLLARGAKATERDTNLSQEAHIVAESIDGPGQTRR